MTWKPKKDIEYISKLEKAISDKYGQDTVANPRSLWDEEKEREYLQQVSENAEKYYQLEDETDMIEQDGILLSKKLISKSNTNSCSVCNKYMLDNRDTTYILRWDSCFSCYVEHIEDREDRWRSGWRPERKKHE